VESAREALGALNPLVNVISHPLPLESSNVEQVLSGYDVVVDGSDNFPTRYLLNDACLRLRIPNVHGAVYRFEGQVSVFWPPYGKHCGPCYRCLYPEPPPPELAPSCAEAGVLGVLPGVIGLLEATDLQDNTLPTVHRVCRGPRCACRYCGDGADFPGLHRLRAVLWNGGLKFVACSVLSVAETGRDRTRMSMPSRALATDGYYPAGDAEFACRRRISTSAQIVKP
jgi:hypothetical protein